MKKFYLLGCLLLFLVPVWGQVEINVKVKSGAGSLRDYLFSQSEVSVNIPIAQRGLARPSEIPATFRSTIPAVRTAHTEEIQNVFTLKFDTSDPQQIIQTLRASGQFEFVEESHSFQLDALEYIPNDDSLNGQWYLSYVKAFDAWDIERGSPQVKVGVLDTGLDYLHPDFQGQVAINPLEDINGNGTFEPWPSTEIRNGLTGDFDGIDGDNNGYTDDVAGYDFTDQPRSPFGGDYLGEDPDPTDDNTHGTVVTGVISARANDDFGIAGLAHGCKLVPIRAFAASGGGEDDDIARAIIYATDNGIQVLNFSFGDVYASNIMHEAIKYAYNKGVIMVSSAGNGTGDELHYPSGYNEVISVSASTADLSSGFESLWPLSSFGVTVDLCAPGADILTTTVTDTSRTGQVTYFTRTQGTSLSAPLVTATAALLLSERGPLSPQQIRGILTSTADDISSRGWDHFTGAGRLNAARALEAAGTSVVTITRPVNDEGTANDQVWITGSVLDPEFLKFHIEYMEGVADTATWQQIVEDQLYQVREDTLALWDLSGLPTGDYTLRIRLEKTDGFTQEDRIRFVRDTTAPNVEWIRAVPAWDNDTRKLLLVFRSDDRGQHVIKYRRNGVGPWASWPYDQRARNAHIILGPDVIPPGDYEFYIETTNEAGLVGSSEIRSLSFQSTSISQFLLQPKSYGLPVGRFLPETYDFDNDGLKEVVINEYDQRLNFGKLKFYEFVGNFFVGVDSIDFKPILIPKDVDDTDGDGLLEVFCSVNDSAYLIEQPGPNNFPSEIIYRNEGNGLFAASVDDTDGDPQRELLLKDSKDYYILDGSGYEEQIVLEDVSGDYIGSIAPRVLVDDFDQDGKREIVFGDFDGDLIVYENEGNTYNATFIDSTDLTKSGVYLTSGNFAGGEEKEIFVAVHTSGLRNGDFEYDAPHWWLRIFRATADNTFEVIWEDFLYDIDFEQYNAASSGNLDEDPYDELVFTTYPRTYVIDYNVASQQFAPIWFYFGSLATHHIIEDFDGNGIAEIGLGRIDSTIFFEWQLAYNGPLPVEQLDGQVNGPTEVKISWPASANASSYEVWRVKDPINNETASIISGFVGNQLVDANLEPEVPYLYVLKSENPGLSPSLSPFGNAVILTPHNRPRLDSVRAISRDQVMAWFSEPVSAIPEDKTRFILDGEQNPIAITGSGDRNRKLLLSFAGELEVGLHTLVVDTTFEDDRDAFLDPNFDRADFVYDESISDCLILSQWEIVSDKVARMTFNRELEESIALDTSNYQIGPVGHIEAIEWASEAQDAIEVTIGEAKLGALGYPISITAEVCAIDGTCTCDEGNTATFSSFKTDLSEVYVYPNPYQAHEVFEGVRFANLTQTADIRVLTVSGRFVTELEETDGDGGFQWDLRDRGGQRIKPGVYIYHVSTEQEGIKPFIGTFTVVE